MRRYITTICVVGLTAVGAVAVASAATPAANKHFSGNGVNSWNQGGRWVHHGTGSFSFRTSKRFFFHNKPYWYINGFRGSYTSSCNSGTLHVNATFIHVNNRGQFSHTFPKGGSNKAPFTISGSFTSRNVTKVNYLVKFNGGCQSRVQGKAFVG